MGARVAVVGSIASELSAQVSRFESPKEALAVGAGLLVMTDTDWERHRAEIPVHVVCAVITTSAQREVCGSYLRDKRVQHLLFRGEHVGSEIAQTVAIAAGEAPLTPASLGWHVPRLATSIRSSHEERHVVESAARFAQEVGARGRAAENWVDALSESLSNAIYNAPRLGAEAPFRELHRRQAVELSEAQRVELRCFVADEQLAFTVTDSFGSLTPEHFHQFIGKALTEAPAPAIEKPGGAGLGLMMMYDRLDRMVALVDPGKRTCLLGVGPLTYGHRRERGRTVQFFESPR